MRAARPVAHHLAVQPRVVVRRQRPPFNFVVSVDHDGCRTFWRDVHDQRRSFEAASRLGSRYRATGLTRSGDVLFAVAGLTVWSLLPDYLRSSDNSVDGLGVY